MINETSLARMKQGVFLINTSRGGLIDTKALVRALKSRKIGGVELDVYENEKAYFFEDLSEEDALEDDLLARLITCDILPPLKLTL